MPRALLRPCAALLGLAPSLALASDSAAPEAAGDPGIFWLALILLLILQTTLIAVLQRSRVRYKKARKLLKQSQKDLEANIAERTQSLHSTNQQLQEEIARHQATEILLRETQDYLHSIINSMPSVLIGVTYEGYVTHWNAAAEHSTGVTSAEAMGKHISLVYPDLPTDSQTIRDAIDRGAALITENIQHGSGSEARYSDLSIYPLIAVQAIGAVIRIDDITQRVHMENMMIQNEKMRSLGELAAGMAHEINNPLSAILHSVQNIHRRTSLNLEANQREAERLGLRLETLHEYLKKRRILDFLDNIRDAGERSASIVTNMLEFSHSSGRSHSRVDLATVIRHCVELNTNTLDVISAGAIEHPRITVSLDSGVPKVEGSSTELQQVFLNLLRNAAQAFNSDDYGPPLDPLIEVRLYSSANYAIIEIEDNGPGMSENVRRHIFEPFFTTKEVGQGTGLGLSVSYFIITEHHSGTIEVDSQPGRGTRFTIRLPLPQDAPNDLPNEIP